MSEFDLKYAAGKPPSAVWRGRKLPRPPLDEDLILAWVDAHRNRCGTWPRYISGSIPESDGDTWLGVNAALRHGYRGLLGDSSLALLLQERRGVRNDKNLPRLTTDEILAWADAQHEWCGEWPGKDSGPVLEHESETWGGVNASLRTGNRGLPGGSSLAQLLDESRDVKNIKRLPNLTIDQILAWADAHYQRHGAWPRSAMFDSVPESPRDNWNSIHAALIRGSRGLPSGSSLARILQQYRNKRNPKGLPPFSTEQILKWAIEFRGSVGRWPKLSDGAIEGTDGETWLAVDSALKEGIRGLSGTDSLNCDRGSETPIFTEPGFETRTGSLARLLARHGMTDPREIQNILCIDNILAWADAHYALHGQWPRYDSGLIPNVDPSLFTEASFSSELTWKKVNQALQLGQRGLPPGSTLAKLLFERRGVPNRGSKPDFTLDKILAWTDVHFAHYGHYPNCRSGAVEGAPDETWMAIENALRSGRRGMEGGTSLSALLRKFRPTSGAA